MLKKLLKGKGDEKSGYAPAKQFVKIESLGDKLSSMAFTSQAETTSKAAASRMQRRRHIVMAQCVHLDQRCHSGCIAKIIGIFAARQTGTSCGFDTEQPRFLAVSQVFMQEGQRNSGEVAAAARWATGGDDLVQRLVDVH